MVRFDIRNWPLLVSRILPKKHVLARTRSQNQFGWFMLIVRRSMAYFTSTGGWLSYDRLLVHGSIHPLSMCAYPKQHLISRRDLLIVQGFINCSGGTINCSGGFIVVPSIPLYEH